MPVDGRRLTGPDAVNLHTYTTELVTLFDLATRKERTSWAESAYTLAVSPDGRLAASASLQGIVVRELPAGAERWKVDLPGGQRRLREAVLYVSRKCEAAQWFGLVKSAGWKFNITPFAPEDDSGEISGGFVHDDLASRGKIGRHSPPTLARRVAVVARRARPG